MQVKRPIHAWDESAHRKVGQLPTRPMVELVFMYHSFCCGLAANELSTQAHPVGANFWKVAKSVDFEALWESALAALVRGLSIAPESRS